MKCTLDSCYIYVMNQNDSLIMNLNSSQIELTISHLMRFIVYQEKQDIDLTFNRAVDVAYDMVMSRKLVHMSKNGGTRCEAT